MKVKINGFDIECTPEEFLRLTREMDKAGQAGQSVDEFQQLPDDFKFNPYKPNPYFLNDDTWKRHPDDFNPSCAGKTAVDENFWKEFNEQKEKQFNEQKEKDAGKAHYCEKPKTLKETPKDFPPYIDCPKPGKP